MTENATVEQIMACDWPDDNHDADIGNCDVRLLVAEIKRLQVCFELMTAALQRNMTGVAEILARNAVPTSDQQGKHP